MVVIVVAVVGKVVGVLLVLGTSGLVGVASTVTW